MKLVYCLSIVSSLIICGGTTWPWPWPTNTTTITAKTATTKESVTNISTTEASTTINVTIAPYNTTQAPVTNATHHYTTTDGSGLNLKGKMMTLSQSSEVYFYPPYYFKAPPSTSPTTSGNRYELRYPISTTRPPAPANRGVSVCLRFMIDDSSVTLFTLDPDYRKSLSFSFENQWYTLTRDSYSYFVSLNPIIPLWSSVRSQPWTSVCVVLDSYKNVVQVFQGGAMSIRKMLPSMIQWSGTPVVKASGFDGQVTDLEVWDYPLENEDVFIFMQNYRSTGTALTWSNITYQANGGILVEDTYALGQSQPLQEQPIRSKEGRGQRHKYRKMLSERRQRKREML